MTADGLRKKYLEFFVSKGHAVIPGASLIPEHDPSVLFTTAGMHPLVPFLLGEKHPAGKRITNIQKCVRTDDIDEVGDFIHHTFFEMMGSWSLGDYFKKEIIEWSYEFMTSSQWLGLEPQNLGVSVFEGDSDAPVDQEAYEAWRALGIPEKRIAKLPKKANWWGPAGITGPCGPDTEMFYWTGDDSAVPVEFDPEDVRWVEIGNDVFMQYNKTAQGSYELLEQKNVDVGWGLDRMLAVTNGYYDDYKTEQFAPIIEEIERLSGKVYQSTQQEDDYAIRVIADHIRAAAFLLAEKLEPSNTEQGYILRRLIRRAVRYGRQIGIKDVFLGTLADVVA
ncbi:MAG: Alanine-tRNA ligase [Parcubacteria group bacterium GW2011_GWA2_46_7]|nr:MAG: Alanine-tRNA ligase [Parcubacteria group bacterium GW2011_GWA2_46_7]